jgi:hypothetical protein
MLYCIVTAVPWKAPRHESKCHEHPTHFIGRRKPDNRQPRHLRIRRHRSRWLRRFGVILSKVVAFLGATQLTAERWQSG